MLSLLYNLIHLIARKGLPLGMTLTMRDHSIIVVPVSTGAPLCPILINVGWDFAHMIPFIKRLRQLRLKYQINAFVIWNRQWSNTAHVIHREILEEFMRKTRYRKATELTSEIIEDYSKNLRTPYAEEMAKRSLEMFVKFHQRLIIKPEHAKLIVMKKHSGGRRLRIDKIKQVKRLRKEGINGHIPSYHRISKLMKTNVSLVHRWAKYPDDELLKRELELSTDK